MHLKNKKIVFIPPNGEIVGQDFALYRLIHYFNKLGVETCLLVVKDINNSHSLEYNTNIVVMPSKKEILRYLEENSFDIIFSRSWMHRYKFAAKISKRFDNVVSYIKDWQELPKKKYQFVYGGVEDYKAIKSIFQNSRIILSHYISDYTNILAKKYDVNKNKFYFFPEFTLENHFSIRKEKEYSIHNIKLLMAAGFASTAQPDTIVNGRPMYEKIRQITNQKIDLRLSVIQKTYNNIFLNKSLYADILFENEFNKYFSIKLAPELNSSIADDYHFGMFADSHIPKNALYMKADRCAVSSKFAFYMECGIPILVHKQFKALSDIVKKNKIGLVFTDDDLTDFRKILTMSQKQYNVLVNNVYKFREEFTHNEKTMYPIMEMFK